MPFTNSSSKASHTDGFSMVKTCVYRDIIYCVYVYVCAYIYYIYIILYIYYYIYILYNIYILYIIYMGKLYSFTNLN